MKAKIVTATLLATLLGVSAQAGEHHHDRGYRSYHHSAQNWVVPMVVGGVVGYVLAQPKETVYVVKNEPSYHEEWVYFSDCDCKRRVLVSQNR